MRAGFFAKRLNFDGLSSVRSAGGTTPRIFGFPPISPLAKKMIWRFFFANRPLRGATPGAFFASLTSPAFAGGGWESAPAPFSRRPPLAALAFCLLSFFLSPPRSASWVSLRMRFAARRPVGDSVAPVIPRGSRLCPRYDARSWGAALYFSRRSFLASARLSASAAFCF